MYAPTYTPTPVLASRHIPRPVVEQMNFFLVYLNAPTGLGIPELPGLAIFLLFVAIFAADTLPRAYICFKIY